MLKYPYKHTTVGKSRPTDGQLLRLTAPIRNGSKSYIMSESQKTDTSNIGLLFPTDSDRDACCERENSPLSAYTASQLELDGMIDLKVSDLGSLFTDDPRIIAYRQDMFRDIEAHPELSDLLTSLVPLIGDITELRRLSRDPSLSQEAYLYSITEIELYTSVLSMMKATFSSVGESVTSEAFRRIANVVRELTDSEYYRDINRKLEELTSRVREVKSVTIGVNLDSRLRAESAGVLSLNNDKFKSGQLIDKILHLDFRSDEMTCIAPLTPYRRDQSENQQLALNSALSSALSDVFRSSVRSWRRVIQSYVLENTDFLMRLLPEIEFVTKAAELIRRLRDCGCTLTYPEIAPREERNFAAASLGNPAVALKLSAPVVPNDFSFDRDGMIYILTGPNRGGKSVITCAVGLAFAMFALGLPICAESARISPCDAIFTHFPQGSLDTIDKGRLGEECSRLEEIFGRITKYSLVLLDESFSSTGAYEAAAIAGEVLAGFSLAGCRVIFSTHLHELASRTAELNERCSAMGGVRIDNLVAEADGEERSFKIVRRQPDGQSRAADIARRYGLSFDVIRERLAGRSELQNSSDNTIDKRKDGSQDE